MLDYTQFQQVFPAGAQLPYDRDLQIEIESSRKSFDGLLFIDRVMKALGVFKAKAYPPKSDSALRQLHQQIVEANIALHHKFSILYYILLDFDEAVTRAGASEAFALASGMPKNYQIFMKGLWYLDQQDFSRAIEYIAHPMLIPEFADEIVTVLVRKAEGNDYSLALSYFNAVQPILKTSAALELLFDAMARSSVLEALLYSRTHADFTREALFRRLIKIALEGLKDDPPPAGASEIAFLPFEADEEAWFEEYLTVGDGKSLRKAKDALLIRRVASDRFADIARLKVSGPWSAVLEGIKAGTEAHQF